MNEKNHEILDQLPAYVDAVRAIKETILTNIVFIGQTPAPTFQEAQRTAMFMERLAESQVDQCSMDAYQNPVAVIQGLDESKPPIFIVAHLDTHQNSEVEYHYSIKQKVIAGPGVIDNSAGVGVMASLPEIFRKLGLRFQSDIVIAGIIHSLGKGNLQGIRHLLSNWTTPIRGAVVVEGGELGRLNYYSEGMKRCDIMCDIFPHQGWELRFRPNAILVINEVINRILKLRLPQRPRARVIIGKISGGFKHGIIAQEARLGLEIQSDDDAMVKSIFEDISDILDGINHEYQVEMALDILSSVGASSLGYNHPLVKTAVNIMKTLDVKPVAEPSGSELSILLARGIPAVTLGISHGENYHLPEAAIEIDPMFTGIAQIIGVIQAMDNGVCDGK